jgi:hypothetical protein
MSGTLDSHYKSGTEIAAHHIDEVIQNLDRIIDHSIASENRLGYFPALNRKVVVQVSRGISEHTTSSSN